MVGSPMSPETVLLYTISSEERNTTEDSDLRDQIAHLEAENERLRESLKSDVLRLHSKAR